ncbi:MAG: A24 family peptidase [Desulfobacteraceae bacterium]|nr:A24 family peptidase [Desulfobacteraceae bacterium]MCF8096091.1 A24 family peptidase [Desulfobacteraceae bacterium]
MSNPILLFVVFCTGLCIGSFLNVCISRIPRGVSIISPGSRCPACGHPIRFYDNIPVISFLLLGARCRNCKSLISIRYPAVELLTGAMACFVVLKYGPGIPALIYFLFIASLMVMAFIDLDCRIIPDRISLTGIVAGLAVSPFLPEITFTESLIGAAAGGGSLFAVAMGYYLITRKEGMGGGDIKLLAMIGAFTGWQGIIFTIFVASAVGTVVGLVLMASAGKNMKFAVPFGPFLSLAAVVYLFFGQSLIHWYLFGIRPY